MERQVLQLVRGRSRSRIVARVHRLRHGPLLLLLFQGEHVDGHQLQQPLITNRAGLMRQKALEFPQQQGTHLRKRLHPDFGKQSAGERRGHKTMVRNQRKRLIKSIRENEVSYPDPAELQNNLP